MKRIVTLLTILIAAIGIVVWPVSAAQAASSGVLTITEAQINRALRGTDTIGDPFMTITNVEVQEGRLGIVGTYRWENQVLPFIMATVPNVIDGHIVWQITGFRLGNTEADGYGLAHGNSILPFSDILNAVLEIYTVPYDSLNITSVTLTNHTMLIAYGGAAAPGGSKPGGQPVAGATPLTGCTVTTLDRVNLRATSDRSSAVVSVVDPGVKLTATARHGVWVQVAYQGSQGWLNVNYLKTSGTCSG
ncbi:MAG TPA: SH3 domain-containing protein [Aggregatilineaceae bacterium]|nr:SH3 domain-containing protein [Aggregatilineaceae bacterium]